MYYGKTYSTKVMSLHFGNTGTLVFSHGRNKRTFRREINIVHLNIGYTLMCSNNTSHVSMGFKLRLRN